MQRIVMRRAQKLRNDWKKEYYETVRDIIEHPVMQEMRKYQQHCHTDCLQHCVNVSYHNYLICRVLRLDARAAARAGLLHDLFLYDWRLHAGITGDRFHAMTHPRRALRNAEKYFMLSELEKDIILKHMWPLTVIPPKSLESLIIGIVDKTCGLFEISEFYSEKWMAETSQKLSGRKKER